MRFINIYIIDLQQMKISKCCTPGALMVMLSLCAHPLLPCAAETRVSMTQSPSAATAPWAIQQQELPTGVYELAWSERQNAVFVASAGDRRDKSSPASVLRLDAQTLDVQAVIPMQRKAFGMALDDASNRLYVGNTYDASVTVVDTLTNTIVGLVELMDKVPNDKGELRTTHVIREITLEPQTHRMYLMAQSWSLDNVLYVVDTRSLKITHKLGGFGTAKVPGVALDSARKRLFVTSMAGELITVDTQKMAITGRVKTRGEQLLGLRYNPASNQLIATDHGYATLRDWQEQHIAGFKSSNPGNELVVFDADTGRELQSVAAPAGPLAILLDEQGKRLFVTNRAAGQLTVYHSDSYALLQTIELPPMPNSLAFDRARNVLYVSIKNRPDAAKDAPEKLVRIAF